MLKFPIPLAIFHEINKLWKYTSFAHAKDGTQMQRMEISNKCKLVATSCTSIIAFWCILCVKV